MTFILARNPSSAHLIAHRFCLAQGQWRYVESAKSLVGASHPVVFQADDWCLGRSSEAIREINAILEDRQAEIWHR